MIYTDVLVIGGGLAGLRIGIGAKRRGHDVIILSLVPPKRSHSCAAQGGMQASLGNVVGMGDNEDVHFEDTVRAQRIGVPTSASSACLSTPRPAAARARRVGVPWSCRIQKGDRQVIINGQKGPDRRPARRPTDWSGGNAISAAEMARLLRFRRHRPRHGTR